jgi:putative phosphoribosyl transferase
MFKDRSDAGRQLAEALKDYGPLRPIVLALPRGGVPIGFEVARALYAPLDVLVVRKVGAPFDPEFGIGAIAPGVQLLDQESLLALGLTPQDLKSVMEQEQKELNRRNETYRGEKPLPKIAGRTVILVDDGLATGITIRAAIQSVRQLKPAKLILAVPVGPADTVQNLRDEVDVLICLETPRKFFAVGLQYLSFPQVSDEEVLSLLNLADRW